MKLLITGGAGYIGSHMVRFAQNKDHEIVVIDNFSTGNPWAIKNCEIINVDLLDKQNLEKSLKGYKFDGVIHFAAKSIVSESLKDPMQYYLNNISGTINLVEVMLKNGNNNLVFSSSAAIYGDPIYNKINEDHPKNPINPYGKSKLMTEHILEDMSASYNLNVCSLRYFNAAGADLAGDIGESHDPETHLIPNVLNFCLENNKNLKVFGDNYNTPDGTCIRDYVHVNDLAQAHLLALKYIKRNTGFFAFNLGNGDGYSVKEIITISQNITNQTIDYKIEPRRDGDPPILVADSTLAKEKLEWSPKHESLHDIILSAWNWHKFNS